MTDLKTMIEKLGEFDEECAELSKWIADFDNGITAPTYGDVARYQHQQTAKVVKALKVLVEDLDICFCEGETVCANCDLTQKIKSILGAK